VNFVARGNGPDEWRVVLVEEGPWRDPESALRRLQERLYGCIDALDGQLAAQFPESSGKRIVIHLDCYNLPEATVAPFFERFSRGALITSDYAEALKACPHVTGIGFAVTFDQIH
jgi:glutathione S-transferase